MMVDPMFMSVQNLRLFLTAVTPTAFAPTVVIFELFVENFLAIKDHFGICWTILDHTGHFSTILNYFDNFRPY